MTERAPVTMIDHPLVQHKLSIMRSVDTDTPTFRALMREVDMFMAYEAFRDIQLVSRRITTPLTEMHSPMVAGKKLVLAPILRAGLGLADGMLDLIPAVRVAHIGLYQNHETLEPIEYYFKTPDKLDERLVALVDPMLATGNSAIAATTRLKQAGAADIRIHRHTPWCRSSQPRSTVT